jgi:hypothetical protein
MSSSTYGATSGGTGNYNYGGSTSYTNYGFKELEKTEEELEVE